MKRERERESRARTHRKNKLTNNIVFKEVRATETFVKI